MKKILMMERTSLCNRKKEEYLTRTGSFLIARALSTKSATLQCSQTSGGLRASKIHCNAGSTCSVLEGNFKSITVKHSPYRIANVLLLNEAKQ